nr:hypothetical protein [uncultured Steroidobacter sp.]
MPDPQDLSTGEVSATVRAVANWQIREENQRLKWKTGVLIGSAAIVIVFYATLLAFIFRIRMCWVNPASTNLIIGILAAIPTLLAINLVRMVARPTASQDPDDIGHNPWLALGKEALDVLKNWSKPSSG